MYAGFEPIINTDYVSTLHNGATNSPNKYERLRLLRNYKIVGLYCDIFRALV